MNSAKQTIAFTDTARRAVHGTVRPLVLPSAFSPGERDAYAQHVRNCEGVGVWPDSPEAWVNRPWHRRQNAPRQNRREAAYPARDCSQGGLPCVK